MDVELFIGILSLILSIVFFMGKGSFLIAGYNTSSKKVKARYDEKKICLFVGIAMLIIALGQFVVYFNEDLRGIDLIFLFAGVGVAIVGTNFFSKKKIIDLPVEEDIQNDKANKRVITASMIFSLVILVFVGIELFIGEVKVDLMAKNIEIQATQVEGSTIKYQDIQNVYMDNDIDVGKRTWGLGNIKLSAGNFENDEFGEYKLYVYNECSDYIVIETSKKYYVFNSNNTDNTKKLYQRLLERVD